MKKYILEKSFQEKTSLLIRADLEIKSSSPNILKINTEFLPLKEGEEYVKKILNWLRDEGVKCNLYREDNGKSTIVIEKNIYQIKVVNNEGLLDETGPLTSPTIKIIHPLIGIREL